MSLLPAKFQYRFLYELTDSSLVRHDIEGEQTLHWGGGRSTLGVSRSSGVQINFGTKYRILLMIQFSF